MHTMLMIYNNSGYYTITMKQNNINQKRNEVGSRVFFYPRITEFTVGPDNVAGRE